ncbi:MAG: hypothetical protein M3P30_07640 [Chloroflexota bacterium]|nr:hypothetical protein [Chloroflexota bacterium]
MHVLVGRHNRSGYASPWFYGAICTGFGAMAIWAFLQTDWLVGAVAVCMMPLTIAGSRLMRRLAEAARASSAAVESKGEHR